MFDFRPFSVVFTQALKAVDFPLHMPLETPHAWGDIAFLILSYKILQFSL